MYPKLIGEAATLATKENIRAAKFVLSHSMEYEFDCWTFQKADNKSLPLDVTYFEQLIFLLAQFWQLDQKRNFDQFWAANQRLRNRTVVVGISRYFRIST